MKLLFMKAKYGGVIGRVIALWTRGPYFHVEVVLDENSTVMLSASPFDGGVRFMDVGGKDLSKYDVVQLPSLSYAQLDCIAGWSREQLGKPYDFWGVFGFVLPFLHDDSNDWFCSEICSEVLIRCGMLPTLITSKITPNDLAKLVRTHGYETISGH